MGSYADIKLNRSVPDWDTVFACDVWYVDHWSLWLDIKLFFQIALLVLSRRGSEQGAAGKMPGFGPH
jgi:lipopolysaccharide/colanic/teichoic acid biosynthesis glycosyltransferase